nr:MAG TPA: hypothetical protein [Caudoviricetes sp.]
MSRNVRVCLMRDYTIPVSQPPGCDTWRPLFVRRMLPPSGFRMITY